MIDISKYKYKYELHMHTMEASACARATGEDMARACKEAGYTGIVITDHAWGGNTCVDRALPWEKWVLEFAKGYDYAHEWGLKNDLTVFFGYEAGYHGTEFLIYGITPQQLMETSELKDADIPRQYDIIHELGGIVIQAHPYRKEDYIPEVRVFSEYVDGAEGINATHSSHLSQAHNVAEWNDMAIEFANNHNLPMTAGSDVHNTNIFGGGIITEKKLLTPKDLTSLILSDEMYLLTDGDRIYDRYGKLLSTV